MCVAAIAWGAHPNWQLVAIGNRDEYHERPAAPLAVWDDGSGIIAGRDLRSGGTWLGVSEAGRFGLVTNLRGFGDPDSARASRGALVTDLLIGSGSFGDLDTARLTDLNPFNLILADMAEARFVSNRPDAVRTGLAHGIFGLSNGALDEPWPKVLLLKSALLDWLNQDGRDFEQLFSALADETLPDFGLHPSRPSDIKREAPDTPVFIRDPVYGTRCSTIVAIDRTGAGHIVERRFSPEGEPTGETAMQFHWPARGGS